jgi:hypothetical protein
MPLEVQKGTVALPCLNSALDGGRWSTACPGHFKTKEETPNTHCTGNWVGPKTNLDGCEKEVSSPLGFKP